jgi:colanic acid/amylovoran biosynthesis protein
LEAKLTDHALQTTALVVNCWDDSNKGDAAITIGVLNTLKFNEVADRLQVSSYVVHSSEAEMSHAFRHVRGSHPAVELIPCYFPALSRSIGKTKALIRFCRSVVKLLVPNLMRDTPLDTAVRKASIVVSNGGLYFGFKPASLMFSIYHLVAFSYPMLLARRLGRPYVLFSQSFGPFPSALLRAWMRGLVSNSAGAWCRESMSRGVLADLGADESRLKVIPDAAFGIKADTHAVLTHNAFSQLRSQEYVAISLRSLVPAGFSEEAEQRYRASFRQAIEWLVKDRKMLVALVAHTQGPLSDEDDRIITREVYDSLTPEIVPSVVFCDEDLSPVELCSLYGQAKLVVATRFHAVVLSICGGAPVIAVPYFGVKTQGAFKDLGLSSFVLEVANMDGDTIIARIESCLSNEVELRATIGSIAEQQFAGAMESGALLKRVADSL